MVSLRACLLLSAALAACSGTAPPEGPPHECTSYEVDIRYSVGSGVPPVDGGAVLVGSSELECLPSGSVSPDDAGRVACVMFVTLYEPGEESACTAAGFDIPSPDVLAVFHTPTLDASQLPTCLVPQLLGSDLDAIGSCSDSSKPGWCYVTGAAAEGCRQTIFVSPPAIMAGAEYTFQCGQGC